VIKKDWRVWKKLITETGVGWSTELGTISATDEWWKAKFRLVLIINSLTKLFVMLYYLLIYYYC
jgi:hypothetical protein